MSEDKVYTFFDANGVKWEYNGRRVYVPLTEEELGDMSPNENGYVAVDLEEALEMLEEYGYMDREEVFPKDK